MAVFLSAFLALLVQVPYISRLRATPTHWKRPFPMHFLSFLRFPWLRRLVWALVGLLALWGVAWLAVPPLLKSQLEQRGGQALGRKLTIGTIDFKPWSLEFTLTDLALASADGRATQMNIARVYVDAELQSLLRLAPVLDAITLEAPHLHLTHLGGGHYDIDDIVARLRVPSDQPPSAPLKFALYNLKISDGALDFTDHLGQTERKHAVRGLHLEVPFLSSLESKRNVTVEPRLAFTLNGSTFDSAAHSTPFAQTRKSEVNFDIQHLDLAPYLAYQPAGLPARLRSAVVDAKLRLHFEQTQQVYVGLSGTVEVSNLEVVDAAGADLLKVQTLQTELADVRPLEGLVKLASLEIRAPTLSASRNRAGLINWDLAGPQRTKIATKKIATTPDSKRAGAENSLNISEKPAVPASASSAASAAAPQPWRLELARLALHQGTVQWRDDGIAPQARLDLTQLELQAQGLRWPLVATPATLEGSAQVATRGAPAQLRFQGEGSDQGGRVNVGLVDVDLGLASPYLAQYLVPQAQGVLEGDLELHWLADQWQVAAPRLAVRDFALRANAEKAGKTGKATSPPPQAPLRGAERAASAMPQFKRLEVTNAQVDLSGKTASIAAVTLRAPNATVHRDAQGRWMVQQWLKEAPDRPQAVQNPTAPWKVSVADLAVQDATVVFDDRSLSRPVRLELSDLKVQMGALMLDGKKPAPLSVSAKVRSGRTEPGSLNYKGTVMWDPVVVLGSLDVRSLPAHALAPYFANQLNVEVLRADTGFKGQLRYAALAAGPEVKLQGDATLEDFRANSIGSATQGQAGVAEELLSWKSLHVPGIQLAMAPGAATRLDVREAALTDFFARVIVHENGRINLRDLVRSDAPAAEGTAAEHPNLASSAPALASAPVAAPASMVAPAAQIKVGPISLVNGKVYFSDRFIKPNYSADLTELTGKLSQFSTQTVDGVAQLADLNLHGRAEGTASVEITGKVNPLARPLALDIQGRVRDLELPPLSPYAIKYAGYGIQRGKLSMDVHYAVLPDGQLTASNNFVLNQLTFGDKVDGAPNSLPVKLAVALLADRNGVIDLNLPISGSLKDPQFSLGAVVWKVITNLVVKAITAPFSLLASALSDGGGQELSSVSFAPGSSVLSTAAQQGLDKVAQALLERPALSMTVAGTASLQGELEGFRSARLAAMLLAEKRRRALVRGQDAATVVAVSEAEAPVLLKEVYKRADITKPRNLLGLAKDMAPAEMEALLKASIPVTEDAMRELALQRGVAVKDYLASRELPTQRLFLGAAKVVEPRDDWTPRAELSLANQ